MVEKAEDCVRCGWRRLRLGARQEEIVEGRRVVRGLVSDLAAMVKGCGVVLFLLLEDAAV